MRGPLERTKPKYRVLVCCEGKNTEPQYIKGYIANCAVVDCIVEFGLCGADPLALVDDAIERKRAAKSMSKKSSDSFLDYDFVFCVYDRDEHERWGDANNKAKSNNIDVIKSNPSFELWLLLHFNDNPGAQHRHELVRRLGQLIPGYSRDAKSIEFSTFKDNYPDALSRAQKMVAQAIDIDEPDHNPITYFYILTERIGRL